MNLLYDKEVTQEHFMPVYSCRPVDIITFVESEYFLGKTTDKGCKLWLYWKKFLDTYSNYREFYFSGGACTGKTFIGLVITLYRFYETLISCNTKYVKKLAIGVFGLPGVTVNLKERLLDMLKNSDFFQHLDLEYKDTSEGVICRNKDNTVVLYLGSKIPDSSNYPNTYKDYYWVHCFFDEYMINKKFSMFPNAQLTRSYSEFGPSFFTLQVNTNEQKEYKNFNKAVTDYTDSCFVLYKKLFIWDTQPDFDLSKGTFPVIYNSKDAYIIDKSNIDKLDNGNYTIIRIPERLRYTFEMDTRISLINYCGIDTFNNELIKNLRFDQAISLLQEHSSQAVMYYNQDPNRKLFVDLQGELKVYVQKDITNLTRLDLDRLKQINDTNWIVEITTE